MSKMISLLFVEPNAYTKCANEWCRADASETLWEDFDSQSEANEVDDYNRCVGLAGIIRESIKAQCDNQGQISGIMPE